MSGSAQRNLFDLFTTCCAAVACTVAIGCQASEQPAPNQEPAPEAKVEQPQKADAPAEKPAPADEKKAAGGDITSVEVCASYVELYRECVKKIEIEGEMALHREALETQVKTWERALQDAGKAEVVAGECKAAMTAAQTALAAYSCKWQ